MAGLGGRGLLEERGRLSPAWEVEVNLLMGGGDGGRGLGGGSGLRLGSRWQWVAPEDHMPSHTVDVASPSGWWAPGGDPGGSMFYWPGAQKKAQAGDRPESHQLCLNPGGCAERDRALSEKARRGLETTGHGWRGHCLGDTQVGYTCIESKLPMGSLQRWGGPTEKPGSHAHPQNVPTGPKEEAEPEGPANPDTRSGVAADRPLVTGKPISLLSTQSSWPITYARVLCMSKGPPAPDTSAHKARGCVHPVRCWGPRT